MYLKNIELEKRLSNKTETRPVKYQADEEKLAIETEWIRKKNEYFSTMT